MAESGRPRRSTKEVSYTSLDGNDDSDDDFANFTPPPPKKAKKKPSKKSTEKPKSTKRKAPAERRPVIDDDAFDQDLQLALALSQAARVPLSKEEKSQNEKENGSAPPQLPQEEVVLVADVHIPEANKSEKEIPDDDSNKQTPLTSPRRRTEPTKEDEDRICFIETVDPETEGKPAGRGQRRAAKTAASRQRTLLGSDDEGGGDSDSGDEYKAADDVDLDDSDGGDDEDNDEDFSLSPVKKKRKASGGEPAKKETTKKKPPAKRDTKKKGNENAPKPARMKKTPLAKRAQSKSFTPPSITTNHSAMKSPSLPAVRQIKRSPLTIAPTDSNGNNPLGGVKLVSPGQPFRLGLSRFARVKPLHSNAKVT